MELIKKTTDYTIIKKRNGRFGVKHKTGRWINGDEKAKILVSEGLVKATASTKEVGADSEREVTTVEVGASTES